MEHVAEMRAILCGLSRGTEGGHGGIHTLVQLLEKNDMFGSTAAALTTVARASMAGSCTRTGWVGWLRRPGEIPENRRTAEESCIRLFISISVVLIQMLP